MTLRPANGEMGEPRKRWVWGFYPFLGAEIMGFAAMALVALAFRLFEIDWRADWRTGTGVGIVWLAGVLGVGWIGVWLLRRGD